MAKDTVICRCEEITEGQILETIENGCRSISEIKRWTRAGMGICQGITCGRLIDKMLCQAEGISPADLESRSVRQPLRPLSLNSLE